MTAALVLQQHLPSSPPVANKLPTSLFHEITFTSAPPLLILLLIIAFPGHRMSYILTYPPHSAEASTVASVGDHCKSSTEGLSKLSPWAAYMGSTWKLEFDQGED